MQIRKTVRARLRNNLKLYVCRIFESRVRAGEAGPGERMGLDLFLRFQR